MEVSPSLYPVTLEVDHPERQSRWKTLFRVFLVIPVLLFAGLLYIATYAIAVATWLAILVKGRIPGWLFDFQIKLIDWETRALAYASLLTDAYPAFEDPYSVRVRAEYPERTSRWKIVIWKYVTSIPHSIVLWFLWIGVLLAIVLGWFSILFIGRFPKGLHGYIVGVGRWQLRVQAYTFSLTDDFPPFSLSGNAGKAGNDTYIISSVIGVLLAAAWIGAGVLSAVVSSDTDRYSVSYSALQSGRGMTVHGADIELTLQHVADPADNEFPLLEPRTAKRFVAIELDILNGHNWDLTVRGHDFHLMDQDGSHEPILVIVGGSVSPVKIPEHSLATAHALFEIDAQARPTQFRYWSSPTESHEVVWEFK